MADEIRRLSDELARDPGSPVYLRLAEALRRRADLDVALKVAERGVQRHEASPEAHDLLARVCVDRGALDRAREAWETVLRLAPTHLGARKGLGYILFKQGDVRAAERLLAEAASMEPDDESIATALAMVRRGSDGKEAGALPGNGPPPADGGGNAWVAVNGHGAAAENGHPSPMGDARELFADLVAGGAHAVVLLDADGLVAAGQYPTMDGRDASQEVGVELSGVRDEAERAVKHLALGEWHLVVCETDEAAVALAPVAEGALLVTLSSRDTPLGYVRRLLERCRARATDWLGADA